MSFSQVRGVHFESVAMGNKGLVVSHRRASYRHIAAGLAALLVVAPSTALAWDTPEHILFGNKIAEPFRVALYADLAPLPVIPAFLFDEDGRPIAGPESFGDYVSAPDFARGLSLFLNAVPVGPSDIACSYQWAREGAGLHGDLFHDLQTEEGVSIEDLPDELRTELSLWEQRSLLDCANAWAVNNNHFGDFAARNYSHYHKWAMVAAKRYRASNQSDCLAAAYTLEGWGQHYLTDAFASGHAWNPPGSYGDGLKGLTSNVATGVQIRMRIHNYLNKNGARMGAPFYSDDDNQRFWGDDSNGNSQEHGACSTFGEMGCSMPNQEAHPQHAMVMQMARMGLGQIAAAAECGYNSDYRDIFRVQADLLGPDGVPADPRRVYVSNYSMCEAMFGKEIDAGFISRLNNLWGLEDPVLRSLVTACRTSAGQMTERPDGAHMAATYFLEKFEAFPNMNIPEGHIDPESEITEEIMTELGCGPEVEFEPERLELDNCGHLVCETPADEHGACNGGMVKSAGCCYENPNLSGDSGVVRMMPWTAVNFNDVGFDHTVELFSRGEVLGGASEFMWFRDDLDVHPEYTGDFELADGYKQTLEAVTPDNPFVCGTQGTFSVYETRVKIPRSKNLNDQALWLNVSAMDEGLLVSVNGQVVRHASETKDFNGELRFPLMTNATPPNENGEYVVRLVHLNACCSRAEEDDSGLCPVGRPLEVTMTVEENENKTDDLGGDKKSGGCNASSGGMTGLGSALFLFAFVALTRRRRRRDSLI